jgi:hypothetical protein
MQNKSKAHIPEKSIEYAQFGMLRFCGYVLFLGVLFLFIISIWFLYARTYTTIGKVSEMDTLGQFATVQMIDINKYKKVIFQFEIKQTPVAPQIIRDPFNTVRVQIPETDQSNLTSTTVSI